MTSCRSLVGRGGGRKEERGGEGPFLFVKVRYVHLVFRCLVDQTNTFTTLYDH